MEWFYDLVVSGSVINVQIQTFRTPFLDTLLSLITFLGNEEFYLLIGPLIYWIIHKSFGRKLIYLLIFSNYVNSFFKNLLDLPRPFQVDRRVVRVVGQSGLGYGLPSGHSQLSVTLWGYTAWYWRKFGRWLMPLAILIMGLIIFSRLYLGVHFPADVIVGASMGLIILLGWLKYEPVLLRLPGQLGDRGILGAGILIPVILLFIMPDGIEGYPSEDAATIAGVFLGVNVGFFYEARQTRFSSAGAWRQYVGRYILGMLIVIAFWAGLRAVFNLFDTSHLVAIILRFIRYILIGCALAWWAPAIFVRLGLAEQEEIQPKKGNLYAHSTD